MNKIQIKTKTKNYYVFIGKDVFESFEDFIPESVSKILFLIDRNVNEKCSVLLKKIKLLNKSKYNLVIHSSEKKKNLITTQHILKYLIENNFDRRSLIVSIGGGLLGDISGFSASIYMRGIKHIQIPTTILSAVDSSIGGKTGVNFYGIKNIIGTFYQPESVFINPAFFYSLPKIEVISGLGELIKYAIINPKLYDFYKNETTKIFFTKEVSDEVILKSIKIKADIVKEDEKEEKGIRKILNLGHTFAHGIESASNFKLKHGEAVFIGIILALIVSRKFNLIEEERILNFINDFRFITVNKSFANLDISKVVDFMRSDKKNLNGKINLVIPSKEKILIDFPVEEKIIYNVFEELSKYLKKYAIQ
ncbi:MAG: 3-dehydroquinate synthase [Ignavibacterium sp.]|nr:3-dehydroquinate synthase [Ignavibacterium sp.]